MDIVAIGIRFLVHPHLASETISSRRTLDVGIVFRQQIAFSARQQQTIRLVQKSHQGGQIHLA
jgi:hypothetical protein